MQMLLLHLLTQTISVYIARFVRRLTGCTTLSHCRRLSFVAAFPRTNNVSRLWKQTCRLNYVYVGPTLHSKPLFTATKLSSESASFQKLHAVS